MPTSKPTVTAEHKEKYAKIMGTPVKSNAPTALNSTQEQASRLNALLSSLPKPKGIGDKMFIFTGKKKIIVDGKQREEEKVNTVDPAKLELEKKEKEKKEAEEKKTKEETEKAMHTKPEENREIKQPKEEKQEKHEESTVKKTEAPIAPAGNIKKDTVKKTKKSPRMLLYTVGVILGLGIWTLIWMYVFGYIPK